MMAYASQSLATPKRSGHYRLMDDKVKAANVAYQSTYLEKYLSKIGLRIGEYFLWLLVWKREKNGDGFSGCAVVAEINGKEIKNI